MAADLGQAGCLDGTGGDGVHPDLRAEVFERRPGLRETVIESTRLKRMASPDEIAYAALYLASPAAANITGTVLDINGGPVDEIAPATPDL